MRTETKLAVAGILLLGTYLILTDPEVVQEALQAVKIEHNPKANRPDTDTGTEP